MHIRSRFSAKDLLRARERRAWGSLHLCLGCGVALAAIALVFPGSARLPGASRAAATTTAFFPEAEEETPAPKPIQLPDVPTPAITVAPPILEPQPLEEPEIPALIAQQWEMDELEDTSTAPDILPPPDFPDAQPHHPAKRTVAVPMRGESIAITPPSYKEAPPPPYPPALKSSHAEGDVRVRIAVDAAGRPARVDILAGSGHREFDTCARDWILRNWRFHPARRGGQSIAGTVTTSVRFILR